MKTINKNTDYPQPFRLKNKKTGEVMPLSEFADYKVILKGRRNEVIRELLTTNTIEQGKLIEQDAQTLKFWVETRDTSKHPELTAIVQTKRVNDELSDGYWDNGIVIETYQVK